MEHLDHPSANADSVELEAFDLTCPSCDADLIADELFLSHRVCHTCGRHFSVSAPERVAFLVDGGVLEDLPVSPSRDDRTPETDPFSGMQRQAERQQADVIRDAVVTGVGRIGGISSVVIALDDHLVRASLGALLTDKIIAALEHARARRFPVVLLCAGGSATEVGPLSLVQGKRLASEFARRHLEGLVTVGVLVHPVSPSVLGALAVHCDVVIAEPGTTVTQGFAPLEPGAQRTTAADLLTGGWIDDIVPRQAARDRIGRLLDVLCNAGVPRINVPEPSIDGGSPTATEALAQLSRADRPAGLALVQSIVPDAFLLRGDRVTGDDTSVICGVGRIESLSVAIVAQDGHSEEESAVGARKMARLARLAGRLELPLILLVDGGARTRGAIFDPSLVQATGTLATILSLLPVPVISIGVGRIVGQVAPSLMAGDRAYLLSNAVFMGDVPESGPGMAPRLPRGPHRVVSDPTVLSARDCVRLGMIDGVIHEPDSSDGADPRAIGIAVRQAVIGALSEVAGTSQRRLVDTRQRRVRNLGQSTPEGLAAARSELWELHEWQRSVGRSIDDLRERWDHLKASQPRVSFQRPDISDLAARLRARRAELLQRSKSGDRTQP